MITYRKVIVLQDIITNGYLKPFYWRDDESCSLYINEAKEFDSIEKLDIELQKYQNENNREDYKNRDFILGKFRVVELLIIEDNDN